MKLDGKCHKWLESNLNPKKKVGSIINLQEQMVETRSWKKNRGLEVETDLCRVCGKYRETIHHLLAGCECLAGKHYLKRHNNALLGLAVAWAKQEGLLEGDTVWYNMRWGKGEVLENSGKKLCWDFEYSLRKTTTARRPDMTLEDKEKKMIWIVDMACPMEKNIEEKRKEKLEKYQQLAFEIRERRPGFRVEIVPVIIGCLGGGMTDLEKQVGKLIDEEKVEEICRTMQTTVLLESETLMRKIISGVIQG